MLDTELIPAVEGNSRRLMVVLHGLGDSVAGYQWLPQALRLDRFNYLLVNAPDPYYGGFSWYDFMGDAKLGVVRSRQLLFELLDQQRKQGFPTEETLMFGFSQGCLMTLEVGCRYHYRFAGCVGISGYVFEPEQLVRELVPSAQQQRFLVTHGTFDPLISIDQVRPQIQLLKSRGLNIEWHELAKEHTIAGEAELAVIRKFITASYPD